MTPTTEMFLRCVIQRHWWQAYSAVAGIPSTELFNAVAALDPFDRAALGRARAEAVGQNGQINQTSFVQPWRLANPGRPPSLQEALGGIRLELPRIEFALDVVNNGRLPAVTPLGLQIGDEAAAGIFVNRPKPHAHPEWLPFWHDLTGWLPPANPNARAITDADIQRAALQLDVEEATVRAVAEVESRGQGFENGRPTLRYELHKFRNGEKGVWAGVGSLYDRTHPHLSQLTLGGGEQYHNGTQAREYSLLHAAMILCEGGGRRRYADAWKAASWGRFQVMGFNYAIAGWDSIESFVASMYSSEGEHLRAFMGFINAKNLARYLRSHNWAAFALEYNGDQSKLEERYRRDYPGLLERAYNRHRQREQQPQR